MRLFGPCGAIWFLYNAFHAHRVFAHDFRANEVKWRRLGDNRFATAEHRGTVVDQRGVGSNDTEPTRREPLRLVAPRCGEVAFDCVPISLIVI
jgi:hypothetical protein